MNNYKPQKGYIVLVSVIVLSAVLLLLAHALSTSGYFQRRGISEFEFKEESYFAALSCTDRALAKLFQDFEYGGDETIIIGSQTCHIDPIEIDDLNTIIITSASVEENMTRLETVLDQDFMILSFQEQ